MAGYRAPGRGVRAGIGHAQRRACVPEQGYARAVVPVSTGVGAFMTIRTPGLPMVDGETVMPTDEAVNPENRGVSTPSTTPDPLPVPGAQRPEGSPRTQSMQ
jgi:hypothetical protein